MKNGTDTKPDWAKSITLPIARPDLARKASFHIGNQTSFAADRMLDPFDFAVANGFAAFEFFPDRGFSGFGGWDESDLDAATRDSIRNTAAQRKIELTVHAPLELNPLDDPEHGRLYGTVAFAHAIGATLLNLHLDMSQGAEQFALCLGPAIRLTAEAGLKLAIENTVWTGPDDFNQLFRSLHRRGLIATAHVGMCFDLGHANLFGATQNNYWSYFDALATEVPVIHLHLHENFGDRDSHLPLFTGPSKKDPAGIAGLLERLRRRKFDGCAILEQWPKPPSLLVDARDKLVRLLRNQTGSNFGV